MRKALAHVLDQAALRVASGVLICLNAGGDNNTKEN
jgi:hypothetical protein